MKNISIVVLASLSAVVMMGACQEERHAQCAMTQQDARACNTCARARLPKDPSPELSEFYSCYNKKDSGSLQGDGTLCSQNNQEGANEWIDVVDDICDACASECCYFCGSEFGTMVP